MSADVPAPFTAKVRTCLWFDGNGEEAARFYVTLLPGSAVENVVRPSADGPALVVEFTIAGAPYMVLNGGPQYKHSEAASISVLAKDQTEIDRLWDALVAGGGAEGRCGWLKDRFGVSWQIVPQALPLALMSPDREAAGRAMAAMMTMSKIDIAAIEKAFRGDAPQPVATAIQPYLFFRGRCEEAIAYYRQALGAEVLMMMRNRDNPEPCDPAAMPPGHADRIMHAALRIGGSSIMMADGMRSGPLDFQCMSLSLTAPTVAEADRLFSALAAEGQVQMAMGATFFSPRFGAVVDKFGVSWMVVVLPAA